MRIRKRQREQSLPQHQVDEKPNLGPRREDWFDTYHLPEGGALRVMLKIEGPITYWTFSNGQRSVPIANRDARLLGRTLTGNTILSLFSPDQARYYKMCVLPMIEQRLQAIYARIQQERFTLKNFPLAMRKQGVGPQ